MSQSTTRLNQASKTNPAPTKPVRNRSNCQRSSLFVHPNDRLKVPLIREEKRQPMSPGSARKNDNQTHQTFQNRQTKAVHSPCPGTLNTQDEGVGGLVACVQSCQVGCARRHPEGSVQGVCVRTGAHSHERNDRFFLDNSSATRGRRSEGAPRVKNLFVFKIPNK